jgi:uncharacterized protein
VGLPELRPGPPARLGAARNDGKILRERAAATKTILARIRRHGPVSTADVSREMGALVDWRWGPTTEGRALLEALIATGRLSLARREGNRRFYDLTERLFPATILERRVTREEAMRHRLLSRHRGVGLLGAGASSEVTIGLGSTAERARILAGLLEDGTLIAAEVEGMRGLRYLLAAELPLLEATASPRAPSVTFLAPLDPLMWDRRLVEALFGFAYKWEVYVPEAKRRHGYYVLPILYGDRLVGRIEPRMDRERLSLGIVGIAFEAGFLALEEPGFAGALGQALRAYQDLVGAARVVWPRSRIGQALKRAAGHLGKEE